jgi:hypothetical protein
MIRPFIVRQVRLWTCQLNASSEAFHEGKGQESAGFIKNLSHKILLGLTLNRIRRLLSSNPSRKSCSPMLGMIRVILHKGLSAAAWVSVSERSSEAAADDKERIDDEERSPPPRHLTTFVLLKTRREQYVNEPKPLKVTNCSPQKPQNPKYYI